MLVATAVVDGVIRGAWLLVADGLIAWSSIFLVRGTIHKPIRVHLLRQIMVWPWQLMVQLIFVKVTVHPVLQIVMTESNKCDARPGITGPLMHRPGDLASHECRCVLTASCHRWVGKQ
jgi:hypothetical protein